MSTKTTYKQTELGLIPEDWEVKKLGEIGNIITGSTPSTTNLEYYKNGTFDFIGPADLNSNKYIDNAEKKVTEKGLNVGRILKQKSVLVTCIGSTIGKIGINKNICITNQQINAIETDKNNSDFIYYSILERKGRLKLIAGEQAVPVLNKTEFSKFKIPVPPLPEQKKIADCLSTWDCAIEKQSALINALTDRKKALMQQLLTGKKRLPGFEGKWKEVKLGEIGEIQTGNTPSKLESENWNGEYYWCTAEDMKSKYVNNTAQKLTKKGWSLARTVKANSILVTCIASIGINAITNVECSFNQQINSITPNENFSTEFIYYLMNNSKENLLKYAGAGALPMLNKNTFSSIKFKFPTLSEQTAIAEILATADRELQLQKEKLAQLQTQKKGLMQVLLTGKKRLIN